jgi:hypothetical protein
MDIEIHDNLRYVDLRYPNVKLPMRNDHILHLFGLQPGRHIPVNHKDKRMIGNVLVRIVPRGELNIKRRVIAHCPTCDKVVCAGHLHQHMKVHNDRTRGSI